MATEDQFEVMARGGGRYHMGKHVTVTMAAGATTTDSSFIPPTGSRVTAIKWENEAAFSGTPTNINLSIGKSAGAQDYVANTDVKSAAAWTAATLVTAAHADFLSWPAGQALFVTLTANGGTNPAGAATVLVEYEPPNPYTG